MALGACRPTAAVQLDGSTGLPQAQQEFQKTPSGILASVNYGITNRIKTESDNEIIWAVCEDYGDWN